jgi:exodeoxyribonuclease III
VAFTVATFNVNSVRARLPILASWLSEQAPDVLCLQETKVEDGQFPADAFSELGYTAAYRGEKGYNGVAILSREPIEAARFGLDDNGPADEARLARVVIHGVPIVNTYVPQGRDPEDPFFQYKLEWFARLRRFFEREFSPDAPLLWVGDLNVAPEPIDVHDPVRLRGHVGFHPDEQAAFARVIDWGFVDVFRKHEPGAGQYTFYDYRAKNAVAKGTGWRVDHILATSPLAETSQTAWIDLKPRVAERPSDHTVLAATFDI